MPDLKEFRLGIIGGCLSHQSDIPHSQLYHRQLDRLLQEGQGIRLKVAITRHFDCDYKQRLEALLEESLVDSVLLHLRVVSDPKSKLLTKRLEDGKRVYKFNPFLYKQFKANWNKWPVHKPDKQTPFIDEGAGYCTDFKKDRIEPGTFKKVFGLRLRSINLALGMMAGLEDWAIADELGMINGFVNACKRSDKPYFILGPTPSSYFWETRLLERINRELIYRFSGSDVPFCLFEQLKDDYGNIMVQEDGLHLNKTGHAFVARKLYKTTAPWIIDILQQKAVT